MDVVVSSTAVLMLLSLTTKVAGRSCYCLSRFPCVAEGQGNRRFSSSWIVALSESSRTRLSKISN